MPEQSNYRFYLTVLPLNYRTKFNNQQPTCYTIIIIFIFWQPDKKFNPVLPLDNKVKRYHNNFIKIRDVAQSGSAPEWGSGGPGFKSPRPDHNQNISIPWDLTTNPHHYFSISGPGQEPVFSPGNQIYAIFITYLLMGSNQV